MDGSFGDFLGLMLALFFWFAVLWLFIVVFGDVFRRNDLSGMGKAVWILLIVLFPLLGVLVYVIVRPTMTEQDRRVAAETMQARRRLEADSRSEEPV